MLGWMIAGCIALFFLLLYFTPLRISIFYGRMENNDQLVVKVSAWGVELKKIDMPVIELETSPAGSHLEVKVEHQKKHSLVKEAAHQITGEEAKRFGQISKKWMERIQDPKPVLRDMMKQIRCSNLEWHTTLGLGDAAATGTLSGLAYGIKSVIISVLSHHIRLRTMPRFSVQPVWNGTVVRTQLSCTLHFRLGHALVAAVRLLLRIRKGREQKWQTTPSEA